MEQTINTNWMLEHNRHFAQVNGFDPALRPQENHELQQKKLDTMIQDGQKKVAPILTAYERDGRLLQDFVAPIGFGNQMGKTVRFVANGGVNLVLPESKGDLVVPKSEDDLITSNHYSLHSNAITQLSGMLGIHGGYVRDLMNSNEPWKNELIAHTLNEFSGHNKRERVLLRSVMGQVRGVLSTKYRRYDSVQLLESFIRQSQAMGMQLIDGHYNDIKVFLEAVHTKVFVVDTPNNGRMIFAFGVRVKNSDFGASRYEVQCIMFQVWCYNMATTQSVLSQIHIGKELPADINFADDTRDYQTKLLETETRDILGHVMSPNYLMERIAEIQKASSVEIDLNNEFSRLFSTGKMMKTEVEMLKNVITASRPEDGITGGNTLLKLSQGVGRVAQDVDADRKRELDELAFSLMVRKN